MVECEETKRNEEVLSAKRKAIVWKESFVLLAKTQVQILKRSNSFQTHEHVRLTKSRRSVVSTKKAESSVAQSQL